MRDELPPKIRFARSATPTSAVPPPKHRNDPHFLQCNIGISPCQKNALPRPPCPLTVATNRHAPRRLPPLAAKGPRHDGEHAVKRGVYAGSFDPVTNGHLWMINKAVDLFDELIVAVGYNPDKHYTFCADERAAMLRETTRQYTNLRVESFENQFLVDYAQSVGANYIVRGIRTASDYEFERTMRYVNSDLHPDITTIFLLPPREFAEVSSTMVKGLVGPKGWEAVIRQYVPGPVHEKLLQLSPRKPR